jgi:hypothetical protein
MPKRYSQVVKMRWFEFKRAGKSDEFIANRYKCDVRTVRKGIAEVQHKQNARQASIDLLKDKIKRHQDSLVEELERIHSQIALPPADYVVLSWYRNGNSIFTEDGELKRGLPPPATVDSSTFTEGNLLREVLKEHLGKKKEWRTVMQWNRACAADKDSRAAAQLRFAAMLKKETGFKLSDRPTDPPFLYSYTAGDLLLKEVFRRALEAKNKIDLSAEITADTSRGQVNYHHNILAEAPGQELECRENLLKACRKLQRSKEITHVVFTYDTLENMVETSRKVLEELILAGVIPGVCRVCRQLGLE